MAKRLKDSRERLQLSRLEGQKQLLSNDIDLTEISFITRNLPVMRFEEAVVDGSIHRTIEGASTVKLSVLDRDGLVSNSGRIADKIDIKIDGLWFRLVQAEKNDDILNLTFESREVAILRTYNGKRTTGWGKMGRVRFAEILVKEASKEINIPFITSNPARLKKERTKQEKAKNRDPGFGYAAEPKQHYSDSTKNRLTVKGVEVTTEQLRIAEIILDTGLGMIVKRKFLVVAIMTAIQESTLYNLTGGDGSSVGVFQEIDIWGTVAQRRDVAAAARRFYTRAIAYEKDHPNATYNDIAQGAQRSAFPNAYGPHQPEAERLVTAYGVAGGDTSTSKDIAKANRMLEWEFDANVDEFQFMRGRPKTLPGGRKGWEKETTWDCLNRMAEEVQWRCFECAGAVYFMTEPWLFMSAPRARVSRNSEGVDRINYKLDIGRKHGEGSSYITIIGRASQWEAPPGSTVEVVNEGVINGKWLVTEIERKIYSPEVTITCKKPRAALPEPKREDLTGLWDNSLQKPGEEYVPTPGFEPSFAPGNVPTGRALREAVLNNPRITFSRTSQSNDILFGLVKDPVLVFMLLFVEAGFPITVTAMRSDHSTTTSSGNVSAHSKGLAVDLGNFGEDNPQTTTAMIWIRSHQIQLKFSQLIGPVDSLVVPLGHYGSAVLEQHDDHIHVGWAF